MTFTAATAQNRTGESPRPTVLADETLHAAHRAGLVHRDNPRALADPLGLCLAGMRPGAACRRSRRPEDGFGAAFRPAVGDLQHLGTAGPDQRRGPRALRQDSGRARKASPPLHPAPGSLVDQSPRGDPSRQRIVRGQRFEPQAVISPQRARVAVAFSHCGHRVSRVSDGSLARFAGQQRRAQNHRRASPALRVNVWNVHLQAGSAARVRSQQILQLADWVHQAEDGQAADLIAGDFNCTPDSEQYAQLTKLLGVDATQLGPQPHFVTYDGCRSATTEARTLDYVFVRLREPQIACAATVAPAMDTHRPEDRLSDHLAVQADFRFELTTLTAQSPTYEMPIAEVRGGFRIDASSNPSTDSTACRSPIAASTMQPRAGGKTDMGQRFNRPFRETIHAPRLVPVALHALLDSQHLRRHRGVGPQLRPWPGRR